MCDRRKVCYSILDPTGNITALVESGTEIAQQPTVAGAIMRLHPEVEQVGFVCLKSENTGCGSSQAALRMAGGEFCGNATMSAAALMHLRNRTECGDCKTESIRIRVSGAAQPVEVRLKKQTDNSFLAAVHMPPAAEVKETEVSDGEQIADVPIVRLEGIAHIIIEPDSPFFELQNRQAAAEQAVCAWCRELGVSGLGLMFLEGHGSEYQMTPLVYIPESGTVFWENSCASGSSAVGMLLAEHSKVPVSLTIDEPGGKLRVTSDPGTGETWLYGQTRLLGQYETEL